MISSKRKVRKNFTLPPHIVKQLSDYAHESGFSASHVVHMALVEFLSGKS